MIDLTQIAEVILKSCQQVDPEAKAVLETLMTKCNTLVELLSELVDLEAPDLKNLLEPVIDEIFVDFNLTLTLAMGQQFKASLVLARTCFESSLYTVFFIDHHIEARMWANSRKDMSFSSTLQELTNPSYIKAACGLEEINADDLSRIYSALSRVYREFSERVHGKYSFLQVVSASNRACKEDTLKDFSKLLDEAIKSIVDLVIIRLNRSDVEEKVPGLGKMR